MESLDGAALAGAHCARAAHAYPPTAPHRLLADHRAAAPRRSRWACACYLLMLGAVPAVLRDRKPIRLQQVAVLWNFGLSAFVRRVVCCMPHLLVGPAGVLTAGVYPAVCSHAAQYGQAEVGFFVAPSSTRRSPSLSTRCCCCCASRTSSSTGDRPPAAPPPPPPLTAPPARAAGTTTACCSTAGTVLSRIGTGLWFASMNYSVHAMMYFYFDLTRRAARQALARRFDGDHLLQLAQRWWASPSPSRRWCTTQVAPSATSRSSTRSRPRDVRLLLPSLPAALLRSYVWKTTSPRRAGARTSGWKSPLKAEEICVEFVPYMSM